MTKMDLKSRPKKTWREVVQKGCHSRELKKGDAMEEVS